MEPIEVEKQAAAKSRLEKLYDRRPDLKDATGEKVITGTVEKVWDEVTNQIAVIDRRMYIMDKSAAVQPGQKIRFSTNATDTGCGYPQEPD